MALTNRDRVSKGMDLLHDGLFPYVRREMKAEYGVRWFNEAELALDRKIDVNSDGEPYLDTSNLLYLMMWRWREVFGTKLGHVERSIVSELLDTRNRWAHQDRFSSDDTYRALDSTHRLLEAIAAPQAPELDEMKQEALRTRYSEQARQVRRQQATGPLVESKTGAAGLTPWREIMTPHSDVAGGNFRKAEFAADLSQVAAGRATTEYQNPRNFYQRTYLTEGLKALLRNALNALHDHADGGPHGDPVIKLQTNFGGGKTHSMLALYHLFSDTNPNDLPGVDTLLAETNVNQPALANRAVLVGTALAPGQPRTTEDGTVINTFWGELAWQLLGRKGYDIIAESDRNRSNPGSELLRELFVQSEPSLILIDEWVAYLRQLYGVDDMPAGTFDTNMSFAQSLAEAVVAAPCTLLVASLPASDIEVGGAAGREALQRLDHVFHRFESIWRPAGTQESYEIVRRRLFEEQNDPDLTRKRDAVIQDMMGFYRSNQADFPSETREESYRRAMEAAYPIHPELFQRLSEDWGSLDKFQRTRGVLRLMSSVIHVLWERGDNSPLIMPGTIPLDHPDVREELLHYLDLGWGSVVEKDVDGEGALPVILDQEDPARRGRYAATRRVARTIFLGSAPIPQAANRGIDERRIMIGSVQPGENPSLFGDALRRLRDRATFLYVDGDRHWYSTQPTVTRLAQDRAGAQPEDKIDMEIISRLRATSRSRGDFSGVHVAPGSTGDVPDEREVRLVVLDPDQPHRSGLDASPAFAAAKEILDSRGTGPRIYKNTLVFLAPDQERLDTDLKQSVATYLAWKSIDDEREELNLDQFQSRQARTRHEQASDTVDRQIPETYRWLLVPYQPEPTGPIEWDAIRLQGGGSLAERASNRLKNDARLVIELGPAILKMRLDNVPLWPNGGKGDHVSIRELQDYYAQYLYLERLRDPRVLLDCIIRGVSQLTWRDDTFAYAQRWDPEKDRYQGLAVAINDVSPLADGNDVLVKGDVAAKQLDRERGPTGPTGIGPTGATGPTGGVTGPTGQTGPTGGSSETVYRRFYGTAEITDHLDFLPSAGQIGEHVLSHMAGQPGAKVRINVEIEVELPEGADDTLRRTVLENANTLGLKHKSFEQQ